LLNDGDLISREAVKPVYNFVDVAIDLHAFLRRGLLSAVIPGLLGVC
jgi:hypothetical protein